MKYQLVALGLRVDTAEAYHTATPLAGLSALHSSDGTRVQGLTGKGGPVRPVIRLCCCSGLLDELCASGTVTQRHEDGQNITSLRVLFGFGVFVSGRLVKAMLVDEDPRSRR